MKEPNKRIRKVFEKKLENAGVGVSKIMKDDGYKEGYYSNPQQLTNSKSWEMLMDEYIPESLIAETHKAAFKANKLVTSPTEGDKQQPDWQTRMKATELGYKIRGKLVDKFEGQIKNIDSELNKLETDYDRFTSEIKEQIVEDDASLQDKG